MHWKKCSCCKRRKCIRFTFPLSVFSPCIWCHFRIKINRTTRVIMFPLQFIIDQTCRCAAKAIKCAPFEFGRLDDAMRYIIPVKHRAEIKLFIFYVLIQHNPCSCHSWASWDFDHLDLYNSTAFLILLGRIKLQQHAYFLQGESKISDDH